MAREKLKELPAYLEAPLQGLAFWIGHRQALFKDWPLSEGALVAEASNLIFAHLAKDRQRLVAEVMYKNLVTDSSLLTHVTGQSRVDLVVGPLEIARDQNISEYSLDVFEVKRASASDADIDNDLLRLFDFIRYSEIENRAFLIVVAEGQIPERFVDRGTGEGANKYSVSYMDIDEEKVPIKVRRVVKAVASFKENAKETAHYAAIVEVFKS